MQYGRFAHPSSKSKSSISIRGMGGNGTLLLIDGRRLGGETESPYEMDRIPADMIERIEIVKGPMSTLYGSDALGGVINIITKKTEETFLLGLDLGGGMNDQGDNGTSKASVNARGRAGKLGAYRSEYEKRNKTTAGNFSAPVNKKFSADVDITGFEAETIWSVAKNHLLVTGGEYREVSRNSAAINPDPSNYEFVNDTHRFKALYFQDEWQITQTTNAILGMRYDDISTADNELTFKAGLVKEFLPQFRVRLNYAEGYRAPDTAELYVISPSPGDIPRIGAESVYGPKKTVHNLDPEFLKSYELYGGVNNIFDESMDKVLGSNVGPFVFAGLRLNF